MAKQKINNNKDTAEDFMKHVTFSKGDGNELVAVDENGKLVPIDELPLELIPEEDVGIATGEDYNPNP
jgi:sulfur carrier protein ThiS